MRTIDEDQAQYVFQAVILTVLADGVAGASEAMAIANIRRDFPELDVVEDLGNLAVAVRSRFDQAGVEPVLAEIAEGLRDRETRELAFVCCARVMIADGETALEEATLLASFQERFELSGADVKRLLAVARRRG